MTESIGLSGVLEELCFLSADWSERLVPEG